ncbi:MAG: hypothetical protein KDA87_05055 [Planctomycetales bacterium]|nr:hypothetical protein [Planctomycetales bacterium]
MALLLLALGFGFATQAGTALGADDSGWRSATAEDVMGLFQQDRPIPLQSEGFDVYSVWGDPAILQSGGDVIEPTNRPDRRVTAFNREQTGGQINQAQYDRDTYASNIEDYAPDRDATDLSRDRYQNDADYSLDTTDSDFSRWTRDSTPSADVGFDTSSDVATSIELGQDRQQPNSNSTRRRNGRPRPRSDARTYQREALPADRLQPSGFATQKQRQSMPPDRNRNDRNRSTTTQDLYDDFAFPVEGDPSILSESPRQDLNSRERSEGFDASYSFTDDLEIDVRDRENSTFSDVGNVGSSLLQRQLAFFGRKPRLEIRPSHDVDPLPIVPVVLQQPGSRINQGTWRNDGTRLAQSDRRADNAASGGRPRVQSRASYFPSNETDTFSSIETDVNDISNASNRDSFQRRPAAGNARELNPLPSESTPVRNTIIARENNAKALDKIVGVTKTDSKITTRRPGGLGKIDSADTSDSSLSTKPLQQFAGNRWMPFVLAMLGLFASIGFNIYLGLTAWDLHGRYQDVVQDLRDMELRSENDDNRARDRSRGRRELDLETADFPRRRPARAS